MVREIFLVYFHSYLKIGTDDTKVKECFFPVCCYHYLSFYLLEYNQFEFLEDFLEFTQFAQLVEVLVKITSYDDVGVCQIFVD